MTAGAVDPRSDAERDRPDPAQDPDRFAAAGQGRRLPDLLGPSRTHEGERDSYQWALGLLAVFAFLAAVALLFSNVLTP